MPLPLPLPLPHTHAFCYTLHHLWASAGQDDLVTPAVLQRVRCAALGALRTLAAAPSAAEAVRPLAPSMLRAAARFLGDKQAPAVREGATEAFMAVARVDADAAWALLVAAARARGGSAWAGLGLPGYGQGVRAGGNGAGPAAALAPLEALCPAPPPTGSPDLPSGLLDCSAAKLRAMLQQVERLPVTWHEAVVRE
jgi:hypothetical protein